MDFRFTFNTLNGILHCLHISFTLKVLKPYFYSNQEKAKDTACIHCLNGKWIKNKFHNKYYQISKDNFYCKHKVINSRFQISLHWIQSILNKHLALVIKARPFQVRGCSLKPDRQTALSYCTVLYNLYNISKLLIWIQPISLLCSTNSFGFDMVTRSGKSLEFIGNPQTAMSMNQFRRFQ